jgi:hypothetical protein
MPVVRPHPGNEIEEPVRVLQLDPKRRQPLLTLMQLPEEER